MSEQYLDTIASISTANSTSAISIIRVSGIDSINIVNKIFKEKDLTTVPSHTIHYGHIYNPENNEVVDEVLVSVFLAPKSYTAENTVEINSHGGSFVTNKVLELVLLNGARLASPGEFTKRAFLNGRIDLTKAEAVMDVIKADSDNSLKIANNTLRGDVKELVDDLRDRIFSIISRILVNIDYPEYDDVAEMVSNDIKPNVEGLLNDVKRCLDKAKVAKQIKNGISTAIVGKPNVGKSSLLNLLIAENKAIVTNIPGTTRDIVEGKINLNGVTLNLIDTAGIRETSDVVEQIGVEKSVAAINNADLVLFVVDASNLMDEEDKKLEELIKDKKVIYIFNKSDLDIKLDKSILNKGILINTIDKNSINIIEKAILDKVNTDQIDANIEAALTVERQIEKMNDAYLSLQEAYNECLNLSFIDLIELPLRQAWVYLGEITGVVSNEDLLDEMFKQFCLGK